MYTVGCFVVAVLAEYVRRQGHIGRLLRAQAVCCIEANDLKQRAMDVPLPRCAGFSGGYRSTEVYWITLLRHLHIEIFRMETFGGSDGCCTLVRVGKCERLTTIPARMLIFWAVRTCLGEGIFLVRFSAFLFFTL